MSSFRLRILAQTLPFLLLAPAVALAQTPPSRAEANAALHASATPGAEHFTRQQLDQILAPIALYPDQLLSDVLMAATYPQQVLDADRWLQDPQHKGLKDDALVSALEPLPWDPSVKSLVPFPQIVGMMAEHIEWTQALGTAFAEDQAQMMARVQALRHLAMRSGKLKSVQHLKVQEEGSEVVITESEPGRIFVPIYNPTVVYGSEWPDRDYPPVYLLPPQGFVAETIEPGLEFSVGYSVVRPLWGWSRPDWREHRITVQRDDYTRITRNAALPSGNVWVHTGPIAFVSPAEAERSTRAATSAQVPAGTVAPGQAAAPRAIAARSGSQQPGAERSQSTAQPNANQPNTSRPERNATGATQPNANEPARDQAKTNQPQQNESNRDAATKNEANQHRGTTSPVEQNRATATRPGNANEPGRTGTSSTNPANPASPEHANRQEERRPGEAARSAEPGRTGTSTANPANPTSPEHANRQEERRPGEAARSAEPGRTEPGANHAGAPAQQNGNAARDEERNHPAVQHEGTTRPEHAKPPAENEPGREHAAPGSGSSQEPAREHEGNRPSQPQAQVPAAQPAPAPAHQAQQQPPHPAPAPAQAEQHAPPHQPPAQGSSTPPGAAAQHPQPQGAQKPGEEPKKEH